jgi:branched-chain amino acid transport system permease protein
LPGPHSNGGSCGAWRSHGHPNELLLTFGVAYVLGEAVKLIWGLSALAANVPALLDGPLFTVYGAAFWRYRAFMMAASAAMLVVRAADGRTKKPTWNPAR